MTTLTHICPKCDTPADRPKHDPEMTVLSCACESYQRIYFEDPAKRIREQLERAEGKFPSNPFLASLRSQFEARGTLSVAQMDRLVGIAGTKAETP